MNNFDFYKELYFHEINRRDRLDNSVNTPIGILTAIGSTQFYLMSQFNNTAVQWINFGFYTGSVLSGVCTLVSIFYLARFFLLDATYQQLPNTTELQDWQAKVSAFYQDNQTSAEKYTEEAITKLMSDLTAVNIYNKDRKSQNLYQVKRFLIFAVPMAIVSAIFLLFI